MLLQNLIHKKFNMLTVIARGSNTKDGKPRWVCQCDCGGQRIVAASNLKNNSTKSCGCLRRNRMKNLASGNTFKQLDKSESGLKAVIRTYQNNAKKKQVPFTLTLEEFKHLTSQNCHYCGRPPSNKSHKGTEWSVYNYNGLDRIDPKKGYTISNVLPCCKRDNYLRNSLFTVEETKVMVSALEDYRKKN